MVAFSAGRANDRRLTEYPLVSGSQHATLPLTAGSERSSTAQTDPRWAAPRKLRGALGWCAAGKRRFLVARCLACRTSYSDGSATAEPVSHWYGRLTCTLPNAYRHGIDRVE